MGMVKVFNLMTAMLDDHRYLVRDYAFDAEEALAYLRRWEGEMTRHIIGPPFIVARFMRFLELESIPLHLDPESMIIMLGGWKQYTGRSISREEFNAKAERYLGVERSRIRDMYGMIESNMLAIECEHYRKHVPPGVTCRSATSPIRRSNSRPGRPAASPSWTPSTPRTPASCSRMTSERSTRATARAGEPDRRCASGGVGRAPNWVVAR